MTIVIGLPALRLPDGPQGTTAHLEAQWMADVGNETLRQVVYDRLHDDGLEPDEAEARLAALLDGVCQARGVAAAVATLSGSGPRPEVLREMILSEAGVTAPRSSIVVVPDFCDAHQVWAGDGAPGWPAVATVRVGWESVMVTAERWDRWQEEARRR